MIPNIKLIADSGSTKTEWCLLKDKKPFIFNSQGMSPYFLDDEGLTKIIKEEVLPNLKGNNVHEIYFYGTGCKDSANKQRIKKAFKKLFKEADIFVENDLFGAARSLCGSEKGIACILGTGSNSCYFNGKKIMKNSPGLGYVLGDEGSGAILGKKVIQHYLYDIFEEDMRVRFEEKFNTTAAQILNSVYHQPLPNKYLATFTQFLVENRGHYMIENIIEDGLNEFFYTHIIRYPESKTQPIHFTGGVAFGFKEVIENLCLGYDLELGKITRTPMEGLIQFHLSCN
ncbi:MAG: N-acetylglucosamine kinase [Ginsengibacter sp.]